MDISKQDTSIALELLVQCIDYGVYFNISVYDLIILPSKFKKLPTQAVEFYFCDIRQKYRNLNYLKAS